MTRLAKSENKTNSEIERWISPGGKSQVQDNFHISPMAVFTNGFVIVI